MYPVLELWTHVAFAHDGRIGGGLFWWTVVSLGCLGVFCTLALARPRVLRFGLRLLIFLVLLFWVVTAVVGYVTVWQVADQLFAGGLGHEGRELYWERWKHVIGCAQMLIVAFSSNICLTAGLVICQRTENDVS